MRVTPLICWSCSTWFQPKTKRKTKFCCGACRSQHALGNKHGYKALVQLYWKDEEEAKEIDESLSQYCDKKNPGCVECLFEKNNDHYCDIVFKYGVDKFGQSAKQWLKNNHSESRG